MLREQLGGRRSRFSNDQRRRLAPKSGGCPKDRYLELAPRHWADTRRRLDPEELDAVISSFEIPPPPAV